MLGLALLGLLLAGGLVLAWPRAPERLHVRTAQIMSKNIAATTAPSRDADARHLAGQWRNVTLPFAAPAHALWRAASRPTGLHETWFQFAAPPPQVLHRPLYMYIPKWEGDGQIAIYTDGRLTYQSHANDIWNGANQPLWLPLEDTAETLRPPHVFLIRFQHRAATVGLSSVWVGNYEALTWPYLTRDFLVVIFPAITSMGLLVTGLFSFVVWVRRRSERMYLIFSLLSVAAFIQALHLYFGLDRLPVSDAWFGWITANSALWMVGLVEGLLAEIHRKPQPGLSRALWGLAAVWAVISFPAAPVLEPTADAPLIYLSALVAGAAVCGSGFYWSWRNRVRAGLSLSACLLVGLVFGIHDAWLETNDVNIEGLVLSAYLNLIITVVFRRVMLGHFVGALTTAEKANQHLAEQLRMREQELTKSHERLRLTEQRQLLIDERQRVMQDMHDGMGSSLVSAVRAVEHGHLDEARIVQVLKDCIDDLKLTIDAMEPAEADLLLLLATLRFRLQPRLDSTGLKLHWQVQDLPPIAWLDQHSSLHILRILQETFTNIIKHARASEILLRTRVEDDVVLITISDNGCGMKGDDRPGHGRGMANQTRRATAINGRVHWKSGPSGTSFCLSLPIVQVQRQGE